MHYAKGDFTESISQATEAATLAEHLSLGNVSYLALTTLGKAYRARKQDHLAAETFLRAIAGIEGMRNQVAGLEQGNQLFFEDKVGPYHEMVDLLLTHKTPENVALALSYAERAKGRVLLDVMSSGRIDLEKVMSQSEKEKERDLNRNIVDLNRRLSEQLSKKYSDSRLQKDLEQQLRTARLKYEVFQDSVYASHPELMGRRRQLPEFFVNDLVSCN